MSTNDMKDVAKKVSIILIAAIIIQAGAALFQTFLIKEQTNQNKFRIEKVENKSENFVTKTENEASHNMLIKATDKNEQTIKELMVQKDADLRYIMDKLDKINENILKLK